MKFLLTAIVMCIAAVVPTVNTANTQDFDNITLQKEIYLHIKNTSNISDCGVVVTDEHVIIAIKTAQVFTHTKQKQLIKDIKQSVVTMSKEREVYIFTGVKELYTVKQLQTKLENGTITLDDIKTKLQGILN